MLGFVISTNIHNFLTIKCTFFKKRNKHELGISAFKGISSFMMIKASLKQIFLLSKIEKVVDQSAITNNFCGQCPRVYPFSHVCPPSHSSQRENKPKEIGLKCPIQSNPKSKSLITELK